MPEPGCGARGKLCRKQGAVHGLGVQGAGSRVGATNSLQRCRNQGAGHGLRVQGTVRSTMGPRCREQGAVHGLRVLWLWPLLFASGSDGA